MCYNIVILAYFLAKSALTGSIPVWKISFVSKRHTHSTFDKVVKTIDLEGYFCMLIQRLRDEILPLHFQKIKM